MMLKYVNRTHLLPDPLDAGPLPIVVLADTGCPLIESASLRLRYFNSA
jgi:hypothetical protein